LKCFQSLSNFYDLIGRIKTRLFTIALAPLFHSHGCHFSITPPLRFANLNRISVGDFVTINSDCWIHVCKEEDSSIAPALHLGNYVAIGMKATISAARQVIIEDYVFTAPNVYISDHGHEYKDVNRPIALQGISECKPVTIGTGTWLGQNVVVLPGSHIGRHCVIGANAVVNRAIPDFSIAVGIPAKVIKRYNFDSGAWEMVDIA
jgi:acetyltransferase-like isoleucine patch superfamily enzyme